MKKLRIGILLYVLLIVAATSWLSKVRTTDWDRPLQVAIYPINADNSAATDKYIAELELDQFLEIEKYFASEAKRYGLAIDEPIAIKLAERLKSHPPHPPANSFVPMIMYWSLKLRYWAWRADNLSLPKDVRIFIMYFDPAKTNRVAHSLGLQKGLIGVVHAFANKKWTRSNNVIIAHEFLHTVGATDKYDPHNNLPYYPQGYAEPQREPLYPQQKAEIMGGRIPVSETSSKFPLKLANTLLGTSTAAEINWQVLQ